MRKLKSCVIASDCQEQLDELRDVVINARYDQQVRSYVSDAGVSFVNVSLQQIPNQFFDVIIIEDQWSIASRILKPVSQCDDVDNVLIVNNASAIELILTSGLPDPAVITLDFLLEGDPNDPEEKLLEAFSSTGHIYRRIKKEWPLSYVMGISAWVIDSDGNPNSLTAPLVNLIRSNSDNVYPKSDQLWSFLSHLIRNVLSIYRIRAEKREVSQRLDTSTKLHNYELSRYTQQHLAGIDDLLLAVAKAIDPYFLWRRGVYERSPPSLHQPFATSLLIEGEPGSGKSVLCEAIARAFGSEETILPKDLGPDTQPRGWRRRLDSLITSFYSGARASRVVVIRADDLVWPRIAEMEPAMAAEWERYMRAVRDYLAHAAGINSGQQPHFEGKVLWLFARNTAEDVGEMFRPLEDYLRRFRIEFPKDLEERKKVLVMHASNEGWYFEPAALSLAGEALRDYRGRDLIGDEHARKGFLTFAINEAQERELKLFQEHQDESQIRYEITVDIVNEWLRGQEHQTISNSREVLNSGDGGTESLGLSGERGSALAAGDVNDYVDEELSNSEKIHLEADMVVMSRIEDCLAANKTLKEIGREVFNAKKNGTRAVQTFLETNRPAKVLRVIPENVARKKWPRLIAIIAGRKAIHKNHPNKYPDYAQRRSF
jgi:hypothetical protein